LQTVTRVTQKDGITGKLILPQEIKYNGQCKENIIPCSEIPTITSIMQYLLYS